MTQGKDARRDAAADVGRPSPATEDSERRIAELVEAVKARDEFISIAAHELRNPMTPLLMQVQMLLTAARRAPELAGSRLAVGLERLEAQVEAYVKRVTTLLDVSRITSGKLHLELSEVDLSELIRRAAAELAPTAEWAGSPLRLAIEDGIVGRLDPLAAGQIAENLLSNAIKFGAGQPIDVELSREGEVVRLLVRDRGVGISQEAQERLYIRFERAVLQSQQGGFGVGLWIVGRLVEAMAGQIRVASRPREGSTFTVMLPLRTDKDER